MTFRKIVADSLRDAVTGDLMAKICDKATSREEIDDIVAVLAEHWSWDLYTRKPGPALLQNGVFTPTDLDLACFMSALADRGAVINIPHYEARGPSSKTDGVMTSSKENRHGKIVGLVAKRDAFSFSVRILDMNVMTTDSVGDYRNFLLTDYTGKWWEGWDVIQFLPTAKENAFLAEKGLWTDNKVYFKNFVHPNRWSSMYGQYYLLTKALMARLEEEAKHYRAEAKRIMGTGVNYPEGEGPQGYAPGVETEKGPSEPIKIMTLLADIDTTALDKGEWPTLENTPDNMILAYRRAKSLSYNVIPKLQFPTRATELAFYQNGLGKFPGWIRGAQWEPYKEKKTEWNRLVVAQTAPGKIGVSLRYRIVERTERVAAK